MKIIRETTRRAALIGSVAILGSLVPRTRALAQTGPLKPVTLRLNYVANAEHAPYYLGVNRGFYKDEGLDLSILPRTGSNDTVRLVGAGNDMFGVAVADSVVVGRGRGVPIVSTAVLLQQSPNVLASLEESRILKPEDLYGKKVGVSSRSTVFAFWQAFVRSAKLDASKISMTDLGTTSSTPVLISRAIDATITLATNEVIALRSEGIKLNVVDLGQYGVQSYGQVLFANEALVKRDPELVRRFTRATLKAWQYTLDHVDEAILALKEAVPETETAREASKWGEITPRTKPLTGSVAFGSQSVAGWKSTYDTFKAAGLVDQDYDPATLMAQVG